MADFYPDCLRMVKRKARKEHQCCECAGKINKGEQYCWYSGIWDHIPATYKRCKECDELASRVEAFVDARDIEDQVAFGELGEYLQEIKNHYYEDATFFKAFKENAKQRDAKWVNDGEK